MPKCPSNTARSPITQPISPFQPAPAQRFKQWRRPSTLSAQINQTIEKDSSAGTANLATPQGLSLLKRSYTIAYETGATPQPLEEGSSEQVVILALNRRSASETFRNIRLLVSPGTKLIRRIEAWPISGSKITFDFSYYRLNTGIPDSRFLYDIPPNADMMNNFLFEE